MFEKYVIMDINFAEGVKMMTAKAIDYSVYSEESLFMELDSTKEQIAELENKKSQIEQALLSISHFVKVLKTHLKSSQCAF